tara:strand:- start:82 stop:267 length:186 start_codon:yes stop_codon:yes gene_type:complete
MSATILSLQTPFMEGYREAKQEYACGNIYCLDTALELFAGDPPDSDFQRGMMKALINLKGK